MDAAPTSFSRKHVTRPDRWRTKRGGASQDVINAPAMRFASHLPRTYNLSFHPHLNVLCGRWSCGSHTDANTGVVTFNNGVSKRSALFTLHRTQKWTWLSAIVVVFLDSCRNDQKIRRKKKKQYQATFCCYFAGRCRDAEEFGLLNGTICRF